MPPHLSTELLEHIFKNFTTPLSTYWGRTSSTPEDPFASENRNGYDYYGSIFTYSKQRSQLATLALVNREFNAIVKPLLYNHIRLFGDEVNLLVRTLAFNVDLRYLVRSLSIEISIDEDNVLQDLWDPEDWTFWSGYKLCLDAIGTQIDFEHLEGGEASLVAHQPIASEHWNGDVESWAPPEDVAAILLYWLSNLTKLQIAFVPDYHLYSDSAGIWRCKGLIECMRSPLHLLCQAGNRSDAFNDTEGLVRSIPAALICTSDVVMANPHERPFWVKASYPPLKFCSFKELEPLWCLPALQTLTLHRIGNESGISALRITSAITRLSLYDSHSSAGEISILLRCFPLLGSLSYSMTDAYTVLSGYETAWGSDMGSFKAAEIMDVALERCPKLENLEMSSLGCQPFDRLLSCYEFYEDFVAEQGQDEDGGDPDTEEELPLAPKTRAWLADKIGSEFDLRKHAALKSMSCHMVDLVGWMPRWSQGEATGVRIARILPRNLQHLKLRYDGLFGAEDDGFSETTFDHLRGLIQDCRELTWDDREDRWLTDLETVVLDVVDTWKHAEVEMRGLQEIASAKGVRLSWEWRLEAEE